MSTLSAKQSKISILSMSQTAVCTALLCVSAFIAIPIPLVPVPFTLQVLMVVLVALLLKPIYALSAQVLYTLLGIIGLPVFSGGKSGFGVILSPTGGFIVGFIIASFLISLLKGKKENIFRYLLVSIFVGIPVIYAVGILFFAFYANTNLIDATIKMTSIFIVIDLVKCVFASVIAVLLHKALRKANIGFKN